MPGTTKGNTQPWRAARLDQAKAVIRGLKKPEGVTQQRWNCVLRLLEALAEYLPQPYPSQETLAKKLNVSVRTVKNWVRWAVELGLLVVEKDDHQSHHGYWDHNRYHLVGISSITPNKARRFPRTGGNMCPQSSSYLRMKKASNLSSAKRGLEEERRNLPAASGPGEISPSTSRTSERRWMATPATQVSDYFQREWEQRLESPRGDFLRQQGWCVFTSAKDRVAFLFRIKQDAVEREHHDVAEICSSIDQFLQQFDAGLEAPKKGQPLWKLWWNHRVRYPMSVSRPNHYVKPAPTMADLDREIERGRQEKEHAAQQVVIEQQRLADEERRVQEREAELDQWFDRYRAKVAQQKTRESAPVEEPEPEPEPKTYMQRMRVHYCT